MKAETMAAMALTDADLCQRRFTLCREIARLQAERDAVEREFRRRKRAKRKARPIQQELLK